MAIAARFVSGVRCVDCGVWCVNCGVWCVNRGVWCVNCGVWCVYCGVWCVNCGVWCVYCGVWCVYCGVWCVNCGVRCDDCGVRCVNCFGGRLCNEFVVCLRFRFEYIVFVGKTMQKRRFTNAFAYLPLNSVSTGMSFIKGIQIAIIRNI